MGHFLEVAYRILRSAEEPLTAEEITIRAMRLGLLHTSGKTPSQTMKSKLSTNILTDGEQSAFMRTDKGLFALRAWRDSMTEVIADRYQKALFDEDIVVFPAESLPKYISQVGLERGHRDWRALLHEIRPLRRRIAEEDRSVIQLVSVFILRHENKILTHKRTKRLPESRLHGFYSLIFGGHLNPEDVAPLVNLTLFPGHEQYSTIERELREEVRLPGNSSRNMSFQGLLYDDAREVSKQHLGIVFEVELTSPDYQIGERGFLMDPKFESLSEIKARISEFENWSVLLLKEKELEWQTQTHKP